MSHWPRCPAPGSWYSSPSARRHTTARAPTTSPTGGRCLFRVRPERSCGTDSDARQTLDKGNHMQMDGGQALIKSLEMEGVEVIFGLPGGAILPVYDPIIDSPIRHILVRHEQGAGHMAEGYAHTTGRPGVAMVTSGPGATNIVTPLCDAMMDSIPMVVITGQVGTAAIGTDAFQECDTVGITRSVTKHNELITDAQDIPRAIREAFHIATTGRPGPVLVDIPKDIVDPRNPRSAMEWYWPDSVDLPGYKPTVKGHPRMIREAARLIAESRRPVIYAGGGILKARAAEALLELAELCGISVVTTLMARGAFPDSHPLCLGMPGMHGNYTAVTSMQKADLLIALGSRFDDRVTGKVSAFAPDAKIIHVDIDPAELGKVRRPDVPIVGDCRVVIEELVRAVRELADAGAGTAAGPAAGQADRSQWDAQLREWKEQYPLRYEQGWAGDDRLKPQFCIEALRDNAPEDTIVVSGVGQHQMWASQFWRFERPYSWVNSGGLGTMGFAVPAAVGAKVGRPESTVWAIDGDGCFQMTAQELVTAASERIPVKVAILNNAYLGMVRQWQELFYEERYSEVYLSPDLPDYKLWAEAMGCVGFRVESPDEVGPAVEKANSIDDRPVVIDFRVDYSEKVYPMVAAGTSNDDIILGPEQGEGGH
ncbi:MAG TPA: acetolactate synthase large subunit [Acidimicrobiales bacterium]|nr:acetolactate synthase large subunit [Acidimicrobiales bacterium]